MSDAAVVAYVYDLSGGMAAGFSGLVGFPLEAIWHTSVVIFGQEWFFGGGGIQRCLPGTTQLGQPLRRLELGRTRIDEPAFRDYLAALGRDRYRGDKYDLLTHNCNTFTEEVGRFLTGGAGGLPRDILDLPRRFMASPAFNALRPLLESASPHGTAMASDPTPAAPGSGLPELPKHIPFGKDYLRTDADISVDKWWGKTKVVCEENGDTSLGESLKSLIVKPSTLDMDTLTKIDRALREWPKKETFPILDALRFILAKRQITSEIDTALKGVLVTCIGSEYPSVSNQLAVKCFVSTFWHGEDSRARLLSSSNAILDLCVKALEREPAAEGLQKAVASLCVNYARAVTNRDDSSETDAAIKLMTCLCETFLLKCTAPEAQHRVLVALGTVAFVCEDAKALALALDVNDALLSVEETVRERGGSILEVWNEVRAIFKE